MDSLRNLKRNNNLNKKKGNNLVKERNIILQKEWSEINLEEFPEIKITFNNPSNLGEFIVSVTPKDGYWKDAKFDLQVNIPEGYPIDPPKVNSITTPIYHTNINFEGNVCMSILKEGWNPTFGLTGILIGIMDLFISPNPYDPLPNRGCLSDTKEAAFILLNNPQQFEKLVRKTLSGGYVSELEREFPKLI